MVEVAIIAPLLILLILGVIDLGRLLFTQVTLHEAVQEAVQLLAEREDHRAEVYVFTDLATPAWSENALGPVREVLDMTTSIVFSEFTYHQQ